MIEVYLVVAMMSGAPKMEAYSDMGKACQAFDAQSGYTPHIYKETINRKNEVTFEEGSCKALLQFTGK